MAVCDPKGFWRGQHGRGARTSELAVCPFRRGLECRPVGGACVPFLTDSWEECLVQRGHSGDVRGRVRVSTWHSALELLRLVLVVTHP